MGLRGPMSDVQGVGGGCTVRFNTLRVMVTWGRVNRITDMTENITSWKLVIISHTLKGLFTPNIPVTEKMHRQVYPCINGDGDFDGKNGFQTYSPCQSTCCCWHIVKPLTGRMTMMYV